MCGRPTDVFIDGFCCLGSGCGFGLGDWPVMGWHLY